jgi:hypothetical protein
MSAIKIANRRVFRASEERVEYTGMGTTLVAAVIEDGVATFSSVGDSSRAIVTVPAPPFELNASFVPGSYQLESTPSPMGTL